MPRKYTQSNRMLKKVNQVIPLASQTFSKSYLQYIKDQAPLFATHAKGAYIWDVDNNKYIDMINGLLPVILGYQYPAVDKAIKAQLEKGITFSLSSPLEYELSKLLIKHIPCAEMVRYGKNGSDVTTAAVRLARAITKREHIVFCGYHGWHDWYIGTTTRKLGVPKATQKLSHAFKYNDIQSLEKLFKQYKNKIATVIMEPMNIEYPQDDFLSKVKTLAHKNGALLIFDEVITGFRYSIGGAQKLFSVTPDLATFGKAMANGMPLSAVVGKKKYMKKMEDVFYSFAFGGETLSLAASIATIKEMEKKPIHKTIHKNGKYLQDKTNQLLKKYGLNEFIQLKGHPSWHIFIIQPYKKYSDLEIKSYLQQEILQAGFLWYGQHNISFSHTQAHFDELLKTYDKLFFRLRELLDANKLKLALKGKPITNIFKVR